MESFRDELPQASYAPFVVRERITAWDKFQRWWYTTPLALLCCGDVALEYESAAQYSHVLKETQRAMLINRGYNMDYTLKSDLMELGNTIGVNLVYGLTEQRGLTDPEVGPAEDEVSDEAAPLVAKVHFDTVTRHTNGVRVNAVIPTDCEFVEDEHAHPGWKPITIQPAGRALARPAFAARMALWIESRHGQMPYSEASYLVAERAYTAACRDANVRHTEMHANRKLALDAYFEVDSIHSWYESRGRLPRFARYTARNYRKALPSC